MLVEGQFVLLKNGANPREGRVMGKERRKEFSGDHGRGEFQEVPSSIEIESSSDFLEFRFFENGRKGHDPLDLNVFGLA